MRTMPPIQHGCSSLWEALGLGSEKVVKDTVHSFAKYCVKEYGSMSTSQFVERVAMALEQDEVLRRIAATLVVQASIEALKEDEGIEVERDDTPLHYELRTRYGLDKEEVVQAIGEMRALVKRGVAPGELLAKIGLGPSYIPYIKEE